jgi:transposase
MRYVGLDVHAKRSTLAILEDGKEPKIQTVKGPLKRVLEVVGTIKDPFEICFEASNGYGVVYEQLAKVARRVVVAHPGQLALIFRSKNKHDRRDALKLAQLLRAGFVPAVHVPRRPVRRWRRLINHRHRLVVQRGGVKTQVRSLLRGLGIEAPKRLWSRQGMAWLCAVVFDDPSDALTRDDHVEHLRYLDGAIRRAEKRLDAIAAEHPGVALLRTIPGIGPRTAEALVAWIDDPRRFATTKAIGKYFGLVPCEDSSGGKTRLGHITKEGPSVVRSLLNQAAWRARSASPHVRAFSERVQRGDKDRKKIAVVATMHYLARVALAMLRSGEVWRHSAA